MATMKITLIGFSNYLEAKNDDLFEFLSVPEGIDRELLINNILLRGGEFEVLYADPDFLKNMIGVWSSKWQHTMVRWINALSIDYNPLENYDRMEEWEDKQNKISSQLETSKGSQTQDRLENAVAQDISKSSGSGSTTNTRSAYESSAYQPHDKAETSSNGDNVSNGITSANGHTSNNSENSNVNSAADHSNGLHTGRMHGNIGVTTSQQMLQAELDISKWNIYEEITDLFLYEFCIYLY